MATKKRKTTSAKSSLPAWLQRPVWHALLLGLLGTLLYANTLGHGYVQDDAIVITENTFTQQGFRGLPGIFQNDTFFGFFQDKNKARLVTGGRYRPLSVATFALEQGLWGQSPFASHLINILLYGGCVVLLFWVLRSSLASAKKWYRALIPLLVTMLFLTHPIHTEAVANIKGRDEIMALLAGLGAWWFSLRGLRTGKWLYHLAGALILFLGMLSKENAFTFIGILPLIWYVFTERRIRDLWLPALPYAAAGVVFLLIRSAILPDTGSGPVQELMNNPFLRWNNGSYEVLTFAEKLPTILYTWMRYLQLLFAPVVLTHDYYPRHIALHTWGDPLVLISALLYLALIAYAVWGVLKRDHLAFGVAFFLITFLPVSNLLFPIGTNMAERLLFMPSVGWALAVGVGLFRLGLLLSQKTKKVSWASVKTPLAIVAIAGILFSYKTVLRNPAWESNYTLFTTDVEVSKRSAKLRNAVGGELLAQSAEEPDPARQRTMREEAVGHLQQAIDIHPLYKNAYLLLGNAYNYLNQYEASIDSYQKALQLDPGYTEARRNLGITYRQAGQYYGEQRGDLNRAIQYLKEALRLQPDDYEVLRLLGVAHGVGGQHQQASAYFEQAVQQQPDNATAWFNLAQAREYAGDTAGAQQALARAQQLDPEIQQKMN
jgi:tetratricopeptide (TPR) repeat protein